MSPSGPTSSQGKLAQLARARLRERCAGKDRVELGTSEPLLLRARPPLLRDGRELGGFLRVSRLEGRYLCRPPAVGAVLLEALLYLPSARRELTERGRGNAGDLRHALLHRSPLDPQARREAGAQVGLVEVTGSEPVGSQQQVTVERPPRSVIAASHVGDDDVRVQVRILRPARAVLVRRGDEARTSLPNGPASSAAHDARLILQVRQRRLPRRLVRLDHSQSRALVPKGVQQTDALWRSEDEIEPGHGTKLTFDHPNVPGRGVHLVHPDRPALSVLAEPLAVRRIVPSDQQAELAIANDAGQLQARRAAARPYSRRLAPPGVVVVEARRH